jgi:hypothetical protein
MDSSQTLARSPWFRHGSAACSTLPWMGRVARRDRAKRRRRRAGWGELTWVGRARTARMPQRHRLRTERAMNGRIDRVENTLHALTDLVVPEPNDAIFLAHEPLCTCFVTSPPRFIAMLGAVNFDDQPRRHTCKVGHVRPNRHLSAEVRSSHRETAETAPEPFFRISHIHAQPAGCCAMKVADGRLGHACHPTPPAFACASLRLRRSTLPLQGRVGASRMALHLESRFASDEPDVAAVIDGRAQSGNGMTGASSGCATTSP